MTDDERAIRGLIETWMSATKAHDLTTVLSLMSDDVVFMTPGREPFGKREFAAMSESMREVSVEGKAEIAELKVIGDWAWARTHLDIAIKPANGKRMQRSGYALTIYSKGQDGRWVLTRDANLLTG